MYNVIKQQSSIPGQKDADYINTPPDVVMHIHLLTCMHGLCEGLVYWDLTKGQKADHNFSGHD